MGTQASPNRRVKTVDTVFGIIEYLQEANGAGVTEVSEALGRAKSTVHDHLATLEEKEYVVKQPDDTYTIGLKFLSHGIHARQIREVVRIAQPYLDDLADETGEVVWLVVEEHGRGVFVSKAMGEHAVQTLGRIGKRAYLHEMAAGKAILAYLPPVRVEEIIDRHGLPGRTQKTITNPETLFEELNVIREQGYAVNRSETHEGVRAVGSAIQYEGEVLGAIAVSGPKNRISGERLRKTIPETLLGTTNAIELRLSHTDEIGLD